jgi:uncharacterized membrane protein YedE/YeeE
MLFGAGILLSGGCILGTLRQIGEGNMTFVVVLLSFIPGMAVIVYGFNPWIKDANLVDNMLLPALFGVDAYYVTSVLAALGLLWLFLIRRKKNGLGMFKSKL